jgi:PAS domain S-box-containing protein
MSDPHDLIERQTILIVDDTPDNIALLSTLLKGRYQTKVATDGARALKIAATEPSPDLILLDIMMPGMDGYEVCRQLKADPRTTPIPVIFLTAKGQMEAEEKGLKLGAVDYITKPISPLILLARVETHLTLKNARQSLQNQNALLNALLDTFPYLVWLKDLDGRFQTVNAVFAESCGRGQVEKVLGRTDFDVWPRALAESYVADDRRVIACGQRKMVEELIADQGVTKWFETYKSPIRDSAGRIIGTAGFAHDITERKLAEEELQRSRLQFITVLDSVDAFVYVADMQTYELLFVNRKIRNLISDAREGALCWQTFQQAQDGPCPFCTNHRLLKTDGQPAEPYTWEFYNPRAQRWMLCRDRAIQWLDGRPVRLEIATDITERKVMEEELRDRIEFDTLIASLSTRFININPSALDLEIEHALRLLGQFSQVDRSYVFLFKEDRRRMDNTHEWCAEGIAPQKAILQALEIAQFPWWMAGLERQENIHIPVVAALPPEAAAEKVLLELLGIQSLVVVPLLSANELLGFLGVDAVRTAKVWSPENVALLRMVGDIFANALGRQRIDNERARLERMRTDFINDASHELRTPLTTIIMMVDLLQGGGDPEELNDYWRVLRSELDRARLLIEDLLTLGRLESGRIHLATQPLDITEVIEQALQSVRLLVRDKGIELVVELPEPLPLVLGNAYALLQVFVNLLNNAVKFTPHQGRVAIRAAASLDAMVVTVSDTGIGIPETEQPRLFERFFRAGNALDHDIPGSGMGLYIIKGILDELGGDISVQSALNQGTTFTIRLPLPRK